nr:uncharacterized protein CTRU02_08325 [Colletotrichum truncatum]KAF6790196.1 hypothetical protein CTRU02_08325 [Colletotrichum truncatum]
MAGGSKGSKLLNMFRPQFWDRFLRSFLLFVKTNFGNGTSQRALKIVAVYQIGLWIITFFSAVSHIRAEQGGGEIYAYIAGMMDDVLEHRGVFMLDKRTE